jgi:uncharacterized protein (DUF362 family)
MITPTERDVVVTRSLRADYGPLEPPAPAPELPEGEVRTVAQAALRDLLANWGLDAARLGSPDWNPLGAWIKPGSRVVLKPNWVLDYNQSGQGLDCLITHPSVIEAVLQYVALARPAQVVLGDAPLQGCDWDALAASCGLEAMLDRVRRSGLEVALRDFRRTVLRGRRLGETREENRRDLSHYVLFDLQEHSLLEELADDAGRFRVTMYNPELMARTHGRRRHQYLVAREVIEADVVVSLPKLKSHKKSCLTGALKNLIGINGNKEYLPHHRKGGAARGGDCYEGGSWLKARVEDLLDAANRRPPGGWQSALAEFAEVLAGCSRKLGEDDNLEGSWYGNDTIWRTCLDLQRILRYGLADGSLAARPQRVVLTITDAIVGGEREGPLANTPIPSGFVSGALNPAAADWIHARLMGYDPERIPLVRHAFDSFPHPLADFRSSQVRMISQGRAYAGQEVFPFEQRAFQPPKGWLGHCELRRADDPAISKATLVA